MQQLNLNDADPLSDALGAVHFRSTIFCRSELSAPWGFSVAAREIVTFHLVERGECWLEVEGASAKTRLETGDLVLLPRGHRHSLRDAPDSPVTRLEDVLQTNPVADGASLHFGGGGPATTLICGGFIFDNRDALPFLPALPPVLLLHRSSRAGSWLRMAQEIMTSEIQANRLGEGTMLSRVSDLIFIEAVRSYFSDASDGPRGWFAALNDRHIGAAISLIHSEPNRDWTVATLASAVAMSRSAFALRFCLLLGESPIRYLTRRRLARAAKLLEAHGLPIARVAEEVGYESDAAFRRAFKRHVGLSPAEYRRAKAAPSA
jgi:AraC family transcriptional regulator, alkane utilization regulator